MSDKLVVNGTIRLQNAGTISYRPTTNSDGGSDYLVISGQNVQGNQEFGGSIELIGGHGNANNTGIYSGGFINIKGGSSSEDINGGNVTIDGGNGVKTGFLLLQSFSDGFVGIGTNRPSSKLHVVGNSIFNGNIKILNAGNIKYERVEDASKLEISGEDGPEYGAMISIIGGAGTELDSYGGNVSINGGTGKYAGNTLLQSNYGKVGIGTNNPLDGQKLHVIGNSYFQGNILIGSFNPTSLSILEVGKASKTYFIDEAAQIGIGWNAFKEGATWKYSNATTPVSRIGYFENGLNFSIAKTGVIGSTITWNNVIQATYNTSNVLETRIGDKDCRTFIDGYLSVGGILPAKMPAGYSLAVAKGILTEKIKVATVPSAEWKDFVFDEGYNLMSLQDVESFIKDYRHLPEVPSSSDVEKNGYELIKMDATLLQKLEEMTLYVIELQKRIKILEESK
ncbi:MAG: hypothetical protein H7329_06165 [Opitutaceae bacterium]|nr:hypothetical protein [Cytophagales bacterium]